jgi:hypothetical protein
VFEENRVQFSAGWDTISLSGTLFIAHSVTGILGPEWGNEALRLTSKVAKSDGMLFFLWSYV